MTAFATAIAYIAAMVATAVTSQFDVPIWVYMLGATGMWGVVFRFWFRKLERRQAMANAKKTEAETEEISVKVSHEAVRLVRSELAEMKLELVAARRVEAELSEKLAAAHAELARVVASAASERHELAADLTAARDRIDLLEQNAEAMRDEIQTLRAQAGQVERRQHTRRDDVE